MMRVELLEGLCIGATIGLAAVAIRTLLGSSSAQQGLALVLAGLALCGVQLLLSLRRARRTQPPADPAPPPASRRPNRKNPFAQELTRNWTGLNDQPIEEPGTPAEATQEQPDRRP
jgi:hypothetical protein